MLVLGGHNALGNVLHVVMGPESDLHQDIHGAKILDVTPLLAAMNGAEKIFLSLTRCRSEQITSQVMTAARVPFMNSFTGTNSAVPAPAEPQPATETAGQKCQYCHRDAQLLPIDGFQVCSSCAAIELGRRVKPRK